MRLQWSAGKCSCYARKHCNTKTSSGYQSSSRASKRSVLLKGNNTPQVRPSQLHWSICIVWELTGRGVLPKLLIICVGWYPVVNTVQHMHSDRLTSGNQFTLASLIHGDKSSESEPISSFQNGPVSIRCTVSDGTRVDQCCGDWFHQPSLLKGFGFNLLFNWPYWNALCRLEYKYKVGKFCRC